MAWKPVMNFNLHRYLSCKAIAGMARDGLYRTSFFMAFANIIAQDAASFSGLSAARLYALEQVGLATALISAWWCCSCSWDSTYPRYAYKGEWMNLPGEVRLWLN